MRAKSKFLISFSGSHPYAKNNSPRQERNKICSKLNYNCVQLTRTIFLTRRPYGSDCWEVETRTINSGCECMWPKHTHGEIQINMTPRRNAYKFLSFQVTLLCITKARARTKAEWNERTRIFWFFHLQHYSSQFNNWKMIFCVNVFIIFMSWMCNNNYWIKSIRENLFFLFNVWFINFALFLRRF